MPSSTGESEQRICVYSSTELQTILDDMARQCLRFLEAGSPLALIGILRRGMPLANMLQQRLSTLQGGKEIPVYPLKVKRYADTLELLHAETALEENPALKNINMANTTILVVDDVLWQGHSLLRTCAYLGMLGATNVRTAILVDRCVARQPVHADVTGIRLQIAADDVIECNVPPFESEFRVDVWRRGK